MKSLLLNQQESRLRTGWRIFIFLLIFWILSATVFVIKPLFGDISKSQFLEEYSLFIVGILALSTSIAVPIGRKFLDKKTLRSLGLKFHRNAIKDLIFGFLLSGGMALVFFLALLTFNLIEFQGFNFELSPQPGSYSGFAGYMGILSLGSLALILLEHTLVGYWEELVFRGYLLQNFADGMGWSMAIVVSCIIYGVVHALNPNAGLLSSLIIMLFGFLRIYGYLSTKQLWLSMGMHIGWNFFQGPVFGFSASGHSQAHLTEISFTSEKTWLTGGAFGPEGSLLIIPVILIALLIMRWYAAKRSIKSKGFA